MREKMNSIGEWLKDILVNGCGWNKSFVDAFDESIVILGFLALVVGVFWGAKKLSTFLLEHTKQRELGHWSSFIIHRKIINYLFHILAGVFFYYLLPMVFIKGKYLLSFLVQVDSVYIVVSVTLLLNALLLFFFDVYNVKRVSRSHSLKSLVQVFQVIVFFVGGIVVISVLVHKSPVVLLTGLGASAAVLMLVFKDSILGFVAGIQLSANDMVRLGDWVVLPDGTANGIVVEITLNTVKIQNWDNTISTVPPYTLVNVCMKNWRGMFESGGRQVNKTIKLDAYTLRTFSDMEVEKLRSSIPLLREAALPANGPITNGQLYRIYLERYLMSLDEVNTDLDIIIAQKEPTEFGVPVQVYFFLRNKSWKDYERIQSDIFDHLLVMVKSFDLKLYQRRI